jgi:CRISPR system Cascade subunit CasE
MNNAERLEGNEPRKLFLSRLSLNLRERAVRRDLADCQAMHRRLLSLFGEAEAEAARAKFGVLYRVETEGHTGKIEVLVQSKEQPDWTRLPAQYLREEAKAHPACKFIADKYQAIDVGMRLRFRLRANPTRKIETKTLADGKRRNGKRVEIRDAAEQAAWLGRKAEQHGFSLCAVRSVDEDKRTGFRKTPRGVIAGGAASPVDSAGGERARPPRLTFASVLFDGELIVTDGRLFREALEHGIGSGKSYGFGLLSIGRL